MCTCATWSGHCRPLAKTDMTIVLILIVFLLSVRKAWISKEALGYAFGEAMLDTAQMIFLCLVADVSAFGVWIW